MAPVHRGGSALVKTRRKLSLLFILLGLVLSGCPSYKPHFSTEANYLKRLQTLRDGDLTVSVAGLSAAESRETFGVDIARKNILALWIKIENADPKRAYFFLERSIEDDYFTASEVAYICRMIPGVRLLEKYLPPFLSYFGLALAPLDGPFARQMNNQIRREFLSHALEYGWVHPKTTQQGFVFIPYSPGTLEVSIDLFRDDDKAVADTVKNFDFFIQIPGIKQDYLKREFKSFYPREKIVNVTTEAEFEKAVLSLPVYTTDSSGKEEGDPVNLVVVGSEEDVLSAFISSKWDETEEIHLESIWKTIMSFSFHKEYRYSPVSSLYLFGRSQDVAFQKIRSTIHERMHARLWAAPLLYRGIQVWAGTVSRDIGVRFTTKTWNLMTHKIGEDIDEAQFYTLSDLIYQNRILRFDFLKGIPLSTPEKPAHNLTDDEYFTDGYRAVIELSKTRMKKYPDSFGW